MANTEPPKGDAAAFKEKVAKLIGATEDVIAKKDGAAAHYKEAANRKDCHKDFLGPRKRRSPDLFRMPRCRFLFAFAELQLTGTFKKKRTRNGFAQRRKGFPE